MNSQIKIQYHVTVQTNINQKANGDYVFSLHTVVLALRTFIPSQQACPSETKSLMLIIIHIACFAKQFLPCN